MKGKIFVIYFNYYIAPVKLLSKKQQKKVEDEEFDRILKEMGIDLSKSKVQTKAESAETMDVVSDNKKR